MFSAKALKTPAERLQCGYSAHLSPPPRLGRKIAAIAERGSRDRGDERIIVKLRRNQPGPTDGPCGGVVRVVAGPGEEIELCDRHSISRHSAPNQPAPPGPRRLEIEPHLLFERLQVELHEIGKPAF